MKDKKIFIVVSGEPVAQGRPKFSTRHGVMRAIDPKNSSNWKQYARLVAQQEMVGKSFLEGQLSLSVRVFRSMPKTCLKRNNYKH